MAGADLTSWRGVYSDLKEQIEAGELPPGKRVPTQTKLTTTYGTSRHAVRRALSLLENEQLIVSWQGRGAFVAGKRFAYRISQRTRFSDNIGLDGRDPRTCLIASRRRPAPASVARLLGVCPRDLVLVGELLRLVDGRPAVLARHYYDPRRFPMILDDIERTGSVTRAFAESRVHDFFRAETIVETRQATSGEAVVLEIPQSQPVLVVTGQNIDSLGRPVEVTEAIARGDRIQLLI